MRFEALVAVGDADQGAGFEAESIDVSPDGMRLRAAYLPEMGQKLLCRFEGPSAEVVAEGEVVWREEQARGGEFGLRFQRLDREAAERLRELCAPASSSDVPQAVQGARVRLHIEGLGSPMKARVRGASSTEIEVGSNLEFLKVGRAIELEDVDAHARRAMTIDHVAVEVDPQSSIPQLVVTLRSVGAKKEEADKAVKATKADAKVKAGTTLLSERGADVAAKDAGANPPSGEADGAEVDVDVDMPEGMKGAGAKVAERGLAAAKTLGPALAGAGARAKKAATGALAWIARKREDHEAAKKAQAPRRTTASPPGGGLRAEGKRVVRGEAEATDAEDVPAKKNPKKAAMIGAVLGVLVVALAAAGMRMSASTPEQTTAAATPTELAAPPPAPAALPAPQGSGTLVANVPLYGATPLSTTETVPPPAPDGAPGAVAAAPGTDPTAAPSGEDDGEDGADSAGGDASGEALTEWGSGNPKNPIVLKIKADGAIERLNGAKGAMGFTISLPGRRALSSGSEVARKDKRLASVEIVNNAYGSEVTLQFKDGVPAYLAKAKGDRLEIMLGGEGGSKGHAASKTKVAQKGSHDGKKKSAKGDKKSKAKKH